MAHWILAFAGMIVFFIGVAVWWPLAVLAVVGVVIGAIVWEAQNQEGRTTADRLLELVRFLPR